MLLNLNSVEIDTEIFLPIARIQTEIWKFTQNCAYDFEIEFVNRQYMSLFILYHYAIFWPHLIIVYQDFLDSATYWRPYWILMAILEFYNHMNKNKKMSKRCSKNPIVCTQDLPNRWKKSILTQAWRTDKNKNVGFLLVCWRHQTEWNFNRWFPYFIVFFVAKIFQIGLPVSELLFKKCYHRPLTNFKKTNSMP